MVVATVAGLELTRGAVDIGTVDIGPIKILFLNPSHKALLPVSASERRIFALDIFLSIIYLLLDRERNCYSPKRNVTYFGGVCKVLRGYEPGSRSLLSVYQERTKNLF